ncbi:MAG TPA: MarR family transcriptional regulator [Saprospiraceae bacterium]|nr:MarR family transcriptional regulator [Saprospiraceae bacterium]
MKYTLIKDCIRLVELFEAEHPNAESHSTDIHGFSQWMANHLGQMPDQVATADWEGKENGRSPESAINTLIVHMNRYAKSYSKSAIHDSPFSTQEEFIYLINLNAFGAMTKMDLIKKNIQEKPVGMLIINRLMKHGWVEQQDSEKDKRSKIIRITPAGTQALNKQMEKIRQATTIVTGDLTYNEKMQLINLLTKLNDFHHPIFCKNLNPAELLDVVMTQYLPNNN